MIVIPSFPLHRRGVIRLGFESCGDSWPPAYGEPEPVPVPVPVPVARESRPGPVTPRARNSGNASTVVPCPRR